MPKSYEDEIRDLLKGMDRFPGEGARGGARTGGPRRPWSAGRPRFGGFGNWSHLDPQRIMGGALILMLFAWIMQGPWARGFPEMYRLAGYISLASIVLFLVALVMYIRRGALRGMTYGANQPPRWRGQVIEFPRRGGPLTGVRNWWRRTTARFSRRPPRPSGPLTRGRDTFQW